MEKNLTSRPLGAELLAGWFLRLFRANRVPFLFSLIFGLLAYGFAFTNKLPNHDDMDMLFGKGATIGSGRWGLDLMERIFPNFSMPWIYGIITIVLVAGAACVLLKIFQIRSRLLQVLLSGCIVVFPSLTGLFGYMFTATSYGVALLLAVLAVWLIRDLKPKSAFLALCCMGLSLSIYQSYISVCASLLILVMIQQLLQGQDALVVLKRGIAYVLFLLISLAGYFAATKVLMVLVGVGFNDYAVNATGGEMPSLLDRIQEAYTTFFHYIIWSTKALVPNRLAQRVHYLLLGTMAVMLALNLKKQKQCRPLAIALLAVLILLLPLAINCMYLVTDRTAIHTLVLYGFVAVYALAALLADPLMTEGFPGNIPELLRRGALNLTALALSLVIVVNTYVANEVYLNMHLKQENTTAFFTTVLANARSTPGFTEGTKLALAGVYQVPDFYDYYFGYLLNELQGVKGFMPTEYSNGSFLRFYLGVDIPMATPEEIAAVMQTQAYQNMDVYPYYGSIALIDDLLVVKFS